MKRILSATLAATTAAMLLCSCGQPSSSAASSSVPSDPTQVTTEITWWAFPTMKGDAEISGQYEQSVIDEFNKKYPNIKVNLEMIDFQNGPEKITTALQGGTGPDIILDAPGRIVDWGKAGYLAPLDDMFTEEMVNDMTSEVLVQSCSDGENYWMYPISSAPFVMAFNKTILEKEGLMDMVPTTGDRTWTTDEFVAVSKELAARGYKGAEIYCGSQGGDQGTRAFIANLYNAAVTNDDLTAYTMDTPEAVKGVQLCLDGIEEGWLTPNTAGAAGDALDHFTQGTVASAILWGASEKSMRNTNLKESGTEVLPVCLPSEDGVPVLEYLVNGFCVFDNGDDARIAASKEFIKFVCDDPVQGPKNVVATNCFPVRKSFGDLYASTGDPDMEFYANISKYYGTYYNTIDGFASMRPFWWSSLQAALTGEKTAQEAMEYFVKESNITIEEG